MIERGGCDLERVEGVKTERALREGEDDAVGKMRCKGSNDAPSLLGDRITGRGIPEISTPGVVRITQLAGECNQVGGRLKCIRGENLERFMPEKGRAA